MVTSQTGPRAQANPDWLPGKRRRTRCGAAAEGAMQWVRAGGRRDGGPGSWCGPAADFLGAAQCGTASVDDHAAAARADGDGQDRRGAGSTAVAAVRCCRWSGWRGAWCRSTHAGYAGAPPPCWLLLGQHSLPVFCFSIVLAFLCRLGLQANPGLPMQVAVNGGGLLGMLAVAATAAWCGTPGRSQRPVRSPVRAPAPVFAAEPVASQPTAPSPGTGRLRRLPLLPRPVALKAAVHHW